MRRILILSALAAAGCSDNTIAGRVVGELYATPQFTLDWGTVSIGQPHVEALELDAEVAPVEIQGIQVTNLTREDVFWDAAAFEENFGVSLLGEGLDTDGGGSIISLNGAELAAEESRNLYLAMQAPVAGYFQADLQLTHDGRGDGVIEVRLRGRAVEPCYRVTPQFLDFGVVPTGTEACRDIRVTTCSALPLALTGHNINVGDFRLTDPITLDDPLLVDGNAFEDIEVCIQAASTNAANGLLEFFSGEQPLPAVDLYANDCQDGLPDAYDIDGDGFTTCGGDCDDDDPNANPSQVEGNVPDGKDNDCDGFTDNRTRGYDDDGDGYCEDPSSCIDGSQPGDCNDGDENVNPGVEEDFGNGIDDDCDGTTDNGTIDLDGDGYTEDGGDCNDTPGVGATIYPGAPELADGLNNDCDLLIDEGTDAFDDDGDGYCEGPTCIDGSTPGDCDDRYNEINPGAQTHPGDSSYPGAEELLDGRDNDCNGKVDDGTDRYDDDGDGYSEIGGDCDDDNENIAPNVYEIPDNGIDDDCNPTTPVGQPE